MLSKKVFLAGEANFSAPPVHAVRADVRDHVESQEGDHRASYARDRGLQKRRQASIVFREIWRAAQFSLFRQHRPNPEMEPVLIDHRIGGMIMRGCSTSLRLMTN
jgi:hypothetical protein